MAFDIKAKAEELVGKIKSDPKLLAQFKESPIPVVEKLIGVDLPDDQIKALVEATVSQQPILPQPQRLP